MAEDSVSADEPGVPVENLAPAKILKKSAADIAERRVYVWNSVSLHQIPVPIVAQELEVSEKTIYDDLKVIRDRAAGEWREARENPEMRLQALADLTLRLDSVFSASMIAAANCADGDNADDVHKDRRAQAQFLRVAMEATTRKGVLLANAGALDKRPETAAGAGGAGFELNLKATFGGSVSEEDIKTLGPLEIRRVLEAVRLLKHRSETIIDAKVS